MSSPRFHRLQELFAAASELPASRQAPFLEDACGDDGDICREVQSLLAVDRAARPLLQTGALGLPEDLSENDLIGPYRIIREIGRGGMGIVYLAEDTRLRRQVALKALVPALRANDKQQARFRREAEIAASVSHPGIATIYALEEWDSDQYIVAEYIPGATLAEEFELGPVSQSTVLDIGIQISAAVGAAHDKSVIHRDLKPQNVVRCLDGRLKILDFGLALAFESDEVDHRRLTETGVLLGTPAYMAPEQLRGEPADSRSDVFALGIVLFEAATGQHPFIGRTVPVTMAAILANEPRGLELLRRNSPELETIITRCLHKDVRERFQSATELNVALRSLQQEGVQEAPQLPTTRSDQRVNLGWWISHQVAVVVFCLALTAALWQVNIWVPDLVTRAAFIGGLTFASVIITLRIHLVVTSRHNRAAILQELSTVMPWARRADWSFSLTLVAAAFDIAGERRLASALLLGVAAAYVAVFLFAEPATRVAVFKNDGPKR